MPSSGHCQLRGTAILTFSKRDWFCWFCTLTKQTIHLQLYVGSYTEWIVILRAHVFYPLYMVLCYTSHSIPYYFLTQDVDLRFMHSALWTSSLLLLTAYYHAKDSDIFYNYRGNFIQMTNNIGSLKAHF